MRPFLGPFVLALALPMLARAAEPLPAFDFLPGGVPILLKASPVVTVEASFAGEEMEEFGTWQNYVMNSMDTAPLVAGLKESFTLFLFTKGFTVVPPATQVPLYRAQIRVEILREKPSTSPIHLTDGVFPTVARDGVFYKATAAGCRYRITLTLSEPPGAILRAPAVRDFTGEHYERLETPIGGGPLSIGVPAAELVQNKEFSTRTFGIFYAAIRRGLATFSVKMDKAEIEKWIREAHKPL